MILWQLLGHYLCTWVCPIFLCNVGWDRGVFPANTTAALTVVSHRRCAVIQTIDTLRAAVSTMEVELTARRFCRGAFSVLSRRPAVTCRMRNIQMRDHVVARTYCLPICCTKPRNHPGTPRSPIMLVRLLNALLRTTVLPFVNHINFRGTMYGPSVLLMSFPGPREP